MKITYSPISRASRPAASSVRALENYEVVIYFTKDILQYLGCLDAVEFIHESLDGNRKDAAEVNRELLDWLSTRDQPDRPFFAFLNYFDAHSRYVLKPGRLRRFGAEPDDDYKRILIDHWQEMDKTGVSPSGVAFASDAYDDCIADLDEQVGKLIDTLDRRGILEHTWLIVVSDHGESFGEHPNIFCHGSSLFDTEVRVPLLIIPPTEMKTPTGLAIRDPVSLRDIAATIVDMAGLRADSSFPGDSLTRFWKKPSARVRRRPSRQAYPNSSRTTPRTATTGAFPHACRPELHSRIRSGPTCAAKSKSANNCTISPKTPVNSTTSPKIPPSRTRSADCARASTNGPKARCSRAGSRPDRDSEPILQRGHFRRLVADCAPSLPPRRTIRWIHWSHASGIFKDSH